MVRGRHYHACVSRDGTCMLGGWNVRQGHGGEGRQAPMQIARAGEMNADDIIAWQGSSIGDDTSSWPNQYGSAVCLDNNGVGETPPDVQYRNWTATVAAFLGALGLHPGHVIDHAASTNRKVDLTAVVPILNPTRWMADIATQHALLTEGPTAVSNHCIAMDVHPRGGYGQLTEKGYVYLNGPGVHYHGGLQDWVGITQAGVTCTAFRFTHTGSGYYITTSDGNQHTFGDAAFHGAAAPDMVPG